MRIPSRIARSLDLALPVVVSVCVSVPLTLLLFLFFSLLPGDASAQHIKPARPDSLVQVYGTVTDATTGRPVYDCTVEHYDVKGKRWSLTQVNSDGIYALFIPTGTPFELRVERENGYADLSRRIEAVPKGTRTFEADLQLTPK